MTRKGKQVTAATLLSLLILMADQIIKIAVKTHMYMHQSIHVTDWFQILFTRTEAWLSALRYLTNTSLPRFAL